MLPNFDFSGLLLIEYETIKVMDININLESDGGILPPPSPVKVTSWCVGVV